MLVGEVVKREIRKIEAEGCWVGEISRVRNQKKSWEKTKEMRRLANAEGIQYLGD